MTPIGIFPGVTMGWCEQCFRWQKVWRVETGGCFHAVYSSIGTRVFVVGQHPVDVTKRSEKP